eukprot:jgi/Galph1/2495/GphlegSOOS_G1150.1
MSETMNNRLLRYQNAINICTQVGTPNINDWQTGAFELSEQLVMSDKCQFYRALAQLSIFELVELFVVVWKRLQSEKREFGRTDKCLYLFGILVRVALTSGKHSQLYHLFLHMAQNRLFDWLWLEHYHVSNQVELQRTMALIAYYWDSYGLLTVFPWHLCLEEASRKSRDAQLVVRLIFGDVETTSDDCTIAEEGSESPNFGLEQTIIEYTRQWIYRNILDGKCFQWNKMMKSTMTSSHDTLRALTYSNNHGISHIGDFPLVTSSLLSDNYSLQQENMSTSFQDFVLLEHFIPVIRECLECIALGIPILLEGPTGCGKTALLQILSRIRENSSIDGTSNQSLQTVFLCLNGFQKSEDFDDLIGSVIPEGGEGNFRWKAGPIGMAMEKGCWLVLEDMQGISSSLYRLGERLVDIRPGEKYFTSVKRKPVETVYGFHLFATRTCSTCTMPSQRETENREETCQTKWEPPGGSWKWRRIHLPNLVGNDQYHALSRILQLRFPSLTFCHPRLLSTILPLTNNGKYEKERQHSNRILSLMDLIRVCCRLDSLRERGEILNNEMAVCECLDVMVAWIPDRTRRQFLYQILSDAWSVPIDTIRNFDLSYRPDFNIRKNSNEKEILIGRAKLKNTNHATSRYSDMYGKLSFMSHTLRLWERIARCVEMNEPVLLSGETGTGKTSAVQELARLMNIPLVVYNLSPQTDWSDLVGTFRSYHLFQEMEKLCRSFLEAFQESFGVEKNRTFLDNLTAALEAKDIGRCHLLVMGAWKRIEQSLVISQLEADKRDKWYLFQQLLSEWETLHHEKLSSHSEGKKRKVSIQEEQFNWRTDTRKRQLSFRFQEGLLVKAMKQGHWILFDEVNLAPFEVLEGLSLLLERGVLPSLTESEYPFLKAHPRFRLFAAMNPPTDVGKRVLSENIRKRFTEIYVEEVTLEEDLTILVTTRYLDRQVAHCTDDEWHLVKDVVKFYLDSRELCERQYLVDGNGKKPQYNLRTLSRMLDHSQCLFSKMKPLGRSVERHRKALFEGAFLSFISPLPHSCRSSMIQLAESVFLNQNSLGQHHMRDLMKPPQFASHFDVISMEGYWVVSKQKVGMNTMNDTQKGQVIEGDDEFVVTPCVKITMKDILRTLQYGVPKYAVLLQGPTAAGKTSLVSYLARCLGQTLVRINHHEHMDLSEYFGSFQMDENGSFQFVEGPLLKAVRNGHWVVLDELNLAPSELLEALNRLLDDNREVYISELSQMVRAHEQFVIFATQNPSGEYAGRKQLSRAFRGRFIELHVDEIPTEELSLIVQKRYHLPSSFAERMIKVMRELQLERSVERVFYGKEALMNARDLFRWACRSPRSKEELAREGFFLLGERCRTEEGRELIRETLLRCIGVSAQVLKDEGLYDLRQDPSLMALIEKMGLVPTLSLCRMIFLLRRAFAYEEPVLLVGETGIGKTTCVDISKEYDNLPLWTVSCHRHLDVSDFVGAFRPKRKSSMVGDKLFEWMDGPLISAMKHGHYFLLDEVNMASDAVIERLNSVLEPERTLTEYGSVTEDANDSQSHYVLKAKKGFRFVAAMNPAGDYGKKECSLAFRNRLTEIWVPPIQPVKEYTAFIQHIWSHRDTSLQILIEPMNEMIQTVLTSLETLAPFERQTLQSMFTWRDIHSWTQFIECSLIYTKHPFASYAHGFDLILLDAVQVGSSSLSSSLESLLSRWRAVLKTQCQNHMTSEDMNQLYIHGISDQSIPLWEEESCYHLSSTINLSLETDTIRRNAFRIVRGMILKKPILLQGPPGIGKTSIIEALAFICGQELIRVNLSEHTEMADLLGMDVPNPNVSSSCSNHQPFVFRPGPLLVALEKGYWILLDELNLAPQSVLEGLNSLLDHRRKIYVPELDREFTQGGGRKNMPKSFQSRFTRVPMEALKAQDMVEIAKKRFPCLPPSFLQDVVQVLEQWNQLKGRNEEKGHVSREELNLRDMLRWLSGVNQYVNSVGGLDIASQLFFESFIVERIATHWHDEVRNIYQKVFDTKWQHSGIHCFSVYRKNDYCIQAGPLEIEWQNATSLCHRRTDWPRLLEMHRKNWWILSLGISHGWPMMVLGKRGKGKKSLVRAVSTLFGQELVELNWASMDANSLIGSYQVANPWETVQDELTIYILEKWKELVYDHAMIDKQTRMSRLEWNKLYRFVQQFNNDKIASHTQAKVSENDVLLLQDELNHRKIECCQLVQDANHWGDVMVLENFLRPIWKKLDAATNKLMRLSKSRDAIFEWVYSPLIEAAKNGRWILLDKAHLYPPAVLDYLNPFLEESVWQTRQVVLTHGPASEKQQTWTINVHPRFRIFFTVEEDKQQLLSKALWNRSLVTVLTETFDLKDVVKLVHTATPVNIPPCTWIGRDCITFSAYEWWMKQKVNNKWLLERKNDYSRWSFVTLYLNLGHVHQLYLPEDVLLRTVYGLLWQQLLDGMEYQWLQCWIQSQIGNNMTRMNQVLISGLSDDFLFYGEILMEMKYLAECYERPLLWKHWIMEMTDCWSIHSLQHDDMFQRLVKWFIHPSTISHKHTFESLIHLVSLVMNFLLEEKQVDISSVSDDWNQLRRDTVNIFCVLWDHSKHHHLDHRMLCWWMNCSWTLLQLQHVLQSLSSNQSELQLSLLILLSFLVQSIKYDPMKCNHVFLVLYENDGHMTRWLIECEAFLFNIAGWKVEYTTQCHVLYAPHVETTFSNVIAADTWQWDPIGHVQWLAWQCMKPISWDANDEHWNLCFEEERKDICSPLVHSVRVVTSWNYFISLLVWNNEMASHQQPQQWLNMVATMDNNHWNLACLISQQQLLWLREKKNTTWTEKLLWLQHFQANGNLSILEWLFEQNDRIGFLHHNFATLFMNSLYLDWIGQNTGHFKALEFSVLRYQTKHFLDSTLQLIASVSYEKQCYSCSAICLLDKLKCSYERMSNEWKNDASEALPVDKKWIVELFSTGEEELKDFMIGMQWMAMGREHLQKCALMTSHYHPLQMEQGIEEWQQILEQSMTYRSFQLFGLKRDEIWSNIQDESLKWVSVPCSKKLLEEYQRVRQECLNIVEEFLSNVDYYQMDLWKDVRKQQDKTRVWNALIHWQRTFKDCLFKFAKTTKDRRLVMLVEQVLMACDEIVLGSCIMTNSFQRMDKDLDRMVISNTNIMGSLPSAVMKQCKQMMRNDHHCDTKDAHIGPSQWKLLKMLYWMKIHWQSIGLCTEQVFVTAKDNVVDLLQQLISFLGLQQAFQSNDVEHPIVWQWNDASNENVWLDESSLTTLDNMYLQAYLLDWMTDEEETKAVDNHITRKELQRQKQNDWFIRLIIELLTQWNTCRVTEGVQHLEEIYCFIDAGKEWLTGDDDHWMLSKESNDHTLWDTVGWMLLFYLQEEHRTIPHSIVKKSGFQFYQHYSASEVYLLVNPLKQVRNILKEWKEQQESLPGNDISQVIEEELERIEQFSNTTPMIRIAQQVKRLTKHLKLWHHQYLGRHHRLSKTIEELNGILEKWNEVMMQQSESEWMNWREERVQSKALEYFLPLYSFLMGTNQLDAILQVVDFYLRTAIMGDFIIRLKVVECLSLLMEWMYMDQPLQDGVSVTLSGTKKQVTEKIQKYIHYSKYEYQSDDSTEQFGPPVWLRQKIIHVGKNWEQSLMEPITHQIHQHMENMKRQDAMMNVYSHLIQPSRWRFLLENQHAQWKTVAMWLSTWKDSFEHWKDCLKTSKDCFYEWLCLLKQNQLCYPSSIPRKYRTISVQLCCASMATDWIGQSCHQTRTDMMAQNEMYYSLLAENYWIQRWLMHMPRAQWLSGDRKQVWNEMNIGLQFGKYFQYISIQLRQYVGQLESYWKRYQTIIKGKQMDFFDAHRFYTQFIEWVTLYKEYRTFRKGETSDDDPQEQWLEQIQSLVESWYLERLPSYWTLIQQLLRVPREKNWKDGIFGYLEELESTLLLAMNSALEEDATMDEDKDTIQWLSQELLQQLQQQWNRLDNEEEMSFASLAESCKTCLEDISTMDKQWDRLMQYFVDSNNVHPWWKTVFDPLWHIISELVQLCIVYDATCCLWWKLTNDMLFTGIKEQWLSEEEEEMATNERIEQKQGVGLQDASIQSMQDANDISNELDEQDWKEAYEKMDMPVEKDKQEEKVSELDSMDNVSSNSVQEDIAMDDKTWKDGKEINNNDKEMVDEVESGEEGEHASQCEEALESLETSKTEKNDASGDKKEKEYAMEEETLVEEEMLENHSEIENASHSQDEEERDMNLDFLIPYH